jgi:hypothetical protein
MDVPLHWYDIAALIASVTPLPFKSNEDLHIPLHTKGCYMCHEYVHTLSSIGSDGLTHI